MDIAVLSLCTIHAGNAVNAIPQAVEMTGMVRTLRERVRSRVEAQLEMLINNVAAGFGAKSTVEYTRMYPVTVNHARETGLAADAAAVVAGNDKPPIGSLCGDHI